MPSLLDHFSDLEDPRWDRYKLHRFTDLLFITICAVICGADGWEDVEDFARAKEHWLRRHLELPNGLPSDDTFRRVISRIDPAAFEACFRRWTCSVVEQTQGEVVATRAARRCAAPTTPPMAKPRYAWSAPGPAPSA